MDSRIDIDKLISPYEFQVFWYNDKLNIYVMKFVLERRTSAFSYHNENMVVFRSLRQSSLDEVSSSTILRDPEYFVQLEKNLSPLQIRKLSTLKAAKVFFTK